MAVLVQDETWLRETVVPRIVAVCPAERIWLFGSRARGDHHPDSDWDVMVVVPAVDRDGAAAIRKAVHEVAAGVQVHVWSRDSFTARLHLQASFPSTVAREGRILYEEVAMSAVDAAMWLRRTQSDLRVAALCMEAEPPEVADAMYHSQQALEKAGKALLAWHDRPLEKTHGLGEIGGAVAAVAPELGERIRGLAGFGVAAMELRYPSTEEEPSPEEIAPTLAEARTVVEAVAARIAELEADRG